LDSIVADIVRFSYLTVQRGSYLEWVGIVAESVALGARAGCAKVPQRILAVMAVGPINHEFPGLPIQLEGGIATLDIHEFSLWRIT